MGSRGENNSQSAFCRTTLPFPFPNRTVRPSDSPESSPGLPTRLVILPLIRILVFSLNPVSALRTGSLPVAYGQGQKQSWGILKVQRAPLAFTKVIVAVCFGAGTPSLL